MAYYEFNVEHWLPFIKDLMIEDARGSYRPCIKTICVPIRNVELIGVQRDDYGLMTPLIRRVNKKLKKPMFFKLSTRSPKDAWQKMAPWLDISDSDPPEVKKDKLLQQLELLKVSSFDDIIRLIKMSERMQDDLREHFESPENNTLSIILQEWRPSRGPEYRCFVRKQSLVDAFAYPLPGDPPPMEVIMDFVDKLSLPFDSYVLDVFIEGTRVYFIEINPFAPITDPGPFGEEIYLD